MGVPALERPMAPKQPEPSPQRGSRRRRSRRKTIFYGSIFKLS